MIDEHARRLAKLEAAFKSGSLDEDTYRAAVEALGGAQASVAGAGSIAQHGGIAAGAGGVAAGTIQGNVYIGAPPRDEAEAVRIYCRVVAQSCGQLPLRGVDVGASDPTTGQKPLGLVNVYIDLDTKTQIEDRVKAKRRGPSLPGERDMRPLGALEAALVNRKLALLGDPGGGKTTFVHHLAQCLAAHMAEPQGKWLEHLPGWTEPATLPIVVLLRDFARSLPDALPERAEPNHLWHFITARLAAQNLDFCQTPLRQALETGHALVLLDGLDEVPTLAQRAFVRDAVTAFIGRFSESRYLVTCRVLSYQPPATRDAPDVRLPDLPAFELAPFEANKIDHFIGAWYDELAALNIVRTEDAPGLARQLRGAVRRPDLWRLASNPLLLTVMALVHTHKGRLPDARAMLYEDTVDILLWRWEQIKASGQDDTPRLRHLLLEARRTDVDLKRALWQLAFEAHAQMQGEGDRVADIGELKLQKALATLKNEDANWARQVMEAMKLRAGLLLERAPEVFTFPHRTFQEYLAGAHLAAQSNFARQACALAEQPGALWREVILLAVGRLVYLAGDTDKPLALVGELCPARAQDTGVAWRKAWLAGDVLTEIGVSRVCDSTLGCDLLARVQNRLAGLLGSSLAPRERAGAGNTLARLGDPRFRSEIGYLPDEPLLGFIEIPAGEFMMGDGEEQRTLELPHFYLARLPVTNAQYDAFVQDGGYKIASYWNEARAAGVWREAGTVQGRHDRKPRAGPEPFGELFSLANHPVVGLTWYEALAYCRWLTQRLRDGPETPDALRALLVKGWQVSLPGEAEWEKATRGLEGSAYPWGGHPDPNRANYDETGIGATSAVGCFLEGASPYGTLDMSGNVWEWCATKWQDSYQSHLDDHRLEGDDPRVLRGGAFDSDGDLVRCAARSWYSPVYRSYSVGFRVMLSPS